MSGKKSLVNLDALIKRADFAFSETQDSYQESTDNFEKITISNLTDDALLIPNLRKPDFQRETNHWNPEQIVSLLESFTNGDLVPSVILWKSPSYIFVIDGGHRLSALRAWISDDYGDGSISHQFFNKSISESQKANAQKTRELVNKKIGSYQELVRKNKDEKTSSEERKKISRIVSRGLSVLWVQGNADKAEESFFKINMQGTPLDDIEELLLRNRKKAVAIAARAVIRSATGHKYWSEFEHDQASKIEKSAKDLHKTLFDPEIKTPIKTLDLPLGGSKAVRTTLKVLIDFLLITNNKAVETDLSNELDDVEGLETLQFINKALMLGKRISGNSDGSLGLHPAVYFYGPSGRHSTPMFMGVVIMLARKLKSNDKTFFKKFTDAREALESTLINYKDLIAGILQRHMYKKRPWVFADFLDELIKKINSDEEINETFLIKALQMEGKSIAGKPVNTASSFSADTKSKTFISNALKTAMKCPICNGYLDPNKSVSYDHIVRKEDGGKGSSENCQLTHPYCNQSIKN